MALLNPPNILPEAMRFLVRAVLATRTGLSETELFDTVAPTGMAEVMASGPVAQGDEEDGAAGAGPRGTGRTIAQLSLGALRHLKMVEVKADEVVLADRVTAIWRKVDDVTPTSFAAELEEAILSADGVRVGKDLIDACAVLAAADRPLQAFDGFDESVAIRRFADHQRRLLATDVQASWAVGNKQNWPAFRRVGTYLGWIEPMDTKGRFGVIPNAATALRRWLPTIGAGTYPAGEFVRLAATRLPFLDGGVSSLRRDVGVGSLSGGLSLTLLALRHRGDLELVKEADAGMLEVSTGEGSSELFSHVLVSKAVQKKRGRK